MSRTTALLGEDLLSLADAARHLHVDPATIWRWQRRGVRTPAGGRVVLDVLKIGGKLFTSREAIVRFAEAQIVTGDRPTQQSTRKESKREDRSAAQRAGAELERMGA